MPANILERGDTQEQHKQKAFVRQPFSLLMKGVLFLIVLLLTLVHSVLLFGRTPPTWVPEPVQNYSFDILLTVAPVTKKFSSIAAGDIGADRVYLDRDGSAVQVSTSKGNIAGTLYTPSGEGSFPAILLLHGSTPEGSRLGLYRLMGKKLAENGYVVLAFDRSGYGASDAPPSSDELSAIDGEEETQAALDYLLSLDMVDLERVAIIGHSAGAQQAITIGLRDERIQKIVLLGPPRRVGDRIETDDLNKSELPYFLRRDERYQRLPEPLSERIYLEKARRMNIEYYLDEFTQQDHKPLLLVDGELESQADREYLENIAAELVEPTTYATIANADHYVNIANFGSIVVYDQQAVDELVDLLKKWLFPDAEQAFSLYPGAAFDPL